MMIYVESHNNILVGVESGCNFMWLCSIPEGFFLPVLEIVYAFSGVWE